VGGAHRCCRRALVCGWVDGCLYAGLRPLPAGRCRRRGLDRRCFGGHPVDAGSLLRCGASGRRLSRCSARRGQRTVHATGWMFSAGDVVRSDLRPGLPKMHADVRGRPRLHADLHQQRTELSRQVCGLVHRLHAGRWLHVVERVSQRHPPLTPINESLGVGIHRSLRLPTDEDHRARHGARDPFSA
jgi:hypothetical protein